MTKRFEDKVVAVTGGSEGIGLATAKLFAAEGARVYVTGRRPDKLDQAVREIGNGAVGVSGDAANLGDLDRLYARIHDDHGRLDVLFANAGIASTEAKPLGLIEEEDFDWIFNLNVRGLLFTVQKALPLMSPGGAIVLNGSVAGVKGFPGQSLYNASKAAVRSFARSWTADLKDRRIRVNVVAPGGTETRLMRDYLEARPGMEDALKQMLPLGRLGEPDEVGRAVLFLASAESNYIAGVELFVDGGSVAV
ncbi:MULTISPECIES: SDR family NAD(P)-dependent oxidoreductase [unclassified Herbaspirillum]|uniref:SDR family NAD(P)-dependent oxidoreductase n=1 Tax=unclassified Herbaspirillum TaxID=2624150 RepID=UPI00114F743C|nr:MULTISPECIES: glucose 1-dehydrogenase [unclassified Herbaspirillum]MBB5392466.1 NAD(P)-dependent dehydrogenase (short-subunit alcohol dehydrogenase family) [Herbaspirillum sp. SJZ102]TQK06105.1 NAD(P)-dependent dehydrogenase (short-subunit alcohol dehydrogenase family) [Herbaspirillum sp. SJZ130]TQK12417.1 NAD(P)-dependent dehydrogenase (short-subunit alcohol dehydrogenase family) [Herbaspirillum sp. SJZ106]